MIVFGARRIPARPMPKSDGQRAIGLRYERRVVKALKAQGIACEHNPWFSWRSEFDEGVCCPDILIPYQDGLIIAEVKLTCVPDALEKLKALYCPIVAKVENKITWPLVIVKSLTTTTPDYRDSISEALECPMPIYQWLGHARIVL